jgi:glutamyl/glutaminyl-tRNA synthetase
MTFRTRQAPSPTGYLHLGTARTVLFTKLLAMVKNGVYYLRLEDTDRNRLNQGAAIGLIQNLSLLGLSPDEGVNSEGKGVKDSFYGVYQYGDFGPYIQSERLDLYHHHAQKLIDQGLAYWSYLTEQDKQEIQETKRITKRPINYWLENLKRHPQAGNLSNQELLKNPDLRPYFQKSVQEGLQDQAKPALYYRLQRDEKIVCHDELLGDAEFDLGLEEDFIILKSDGFPTYHLAHLVDDQLMETSLVVRAQEWFASLPKHVTMYRDYWGQELKYIHLPVILGETGNKKMSKRDGNVNVQDYLDKGYLPEAIINYLAFLGWNPGTDRELYLEPADFKN